MPIPRIVRLPIAALALVLASLAFAQAPTYESPSLGFRIGPPSGWTPSEQTAPDGTLVLQFAPPSGQGAVGLVAAPIGAADRAYWSGPREQLVQDVWSGFLPEVPGAQITQSYEIAVDGAQGSVIDYASENVAGTIVLVVGDVAAYTFFSVGDQATLPTAQSGLEALVGSFAFLGAGAPAGSMGTPGAVPPTPAGNPGAAPPSASGASAAGAAPTNPLGAGGVAAGSPAGTAAVGVFADERLQLTLAAAAEGLAGELVFDGVRYPVVARAQGVGVAGHFVAGGTSYAFEAELDGDTMTFVTDDARFVLQRVR
jgi:hypothetical protein